MPLFDTATSSATPAIRHGLRRLSLVKPENKDSAQVWSSNGFRIAVSSLVLFYGLALASWLLTGTVVPWDSKNHFYAMFRFLGTLCTMARFRFGIPIISAAIRRSLIRSL